MAYFKEKAEKTGTCDSCDAEDLLVIEIEHRFVPRVGSTTIENVNLCEICYKTGTSKQYLYPSVDVDNSEILKAIAEVGNIIRKDIQNINNRA